MLVAPFSERAAASLSHSRLPPLAEMGDSPDANAATERSKCLEGDAGAVHAYRDAYTTTR